MTVYELNMDGLVGPTHHYAGLSAGNIASTQHAMTIANPRAAALQGIQKMRILHQLGIKQAVLPPHPRPNIDLLRQLGFSGSTLDILKKAKKDAPELLSACYSASSMWTANAATIAPSIDTLDKRVHFTAANLISNLHRHQEASFSYLLLKRIFANESHFHHHLPLPATTLTRDEGAANHNRLCQTHADFGTHLFVYNQQMLPAGNQVSVPLRYPARQTREASEAITRSHQLNSKHVLFVQQNPQVVDQGVFHNDVIAMANESLFILHEKAFVNQHDLLGRLDTKFQIIEVKSKHMTIENAVKSYFFNSQLITLPDQTMALIAPSECEHAPGIKAYIDELLTVKNNPISQVYYLNLKQSMRNGGGPACLRLRIVLNEQELSAMHQGVLVHDSLLNQLEDWVKKHYRTELHAHDLDDPELMNECNRALDELTDLLQLSKLYSFQTTAR